MWAEEQAMEIEALQAIYADDIKILSDSPHQFEISLVPNTDGKDNHVSISLLITYTPTYPQEAPQIEVRRIKGVEDAQCEELHNKLEAEAQQNLEVVMVLTLAQTAKEWLEELNDAKIKEIKAAQAAKEKAEREEKIVRIDLTEAKPEKVVIIGTPVTKENFLEWSAKLEAEKKAKIKKKTGDIRLTGKQIFKLDPAYIDDQQMLKALAAIKASNASYLSDDLGDDDGVPIEEQGPNSGVRVDASLFVPSEGTEDLPEFSDEED